MAHLKKYDRCAACGTTITMALRSRWSPYFCAPCDRARMDSIDRQMDVIRERLGEPRKYPKP